MSTSVAQARATARWRAKNPERHAATTAASQARRRKTLRAIIQDAKARPCVDCGVQYPPYVMDFDHRDPSGKSASVGEMVGRTSLARMVAEIAKCDVVCANCHRVRTHA